MYLAMKNIYYEKTLESDFSKRKDLTLLKQGKMEDAQKAKEEIE